jgi:hypothetical protein
MTKMEELIQEMQNGRRPDPHPGQDDGPGPS